MIDTIALPLQLFAGEVQYILIMAYQRYVERGVDEDTETFYKRNVWPVTRGSDAFVEIAYANALSHGPEDARNRRGETVPIKNIIKAVADFYD